MSKPNCYDCIHRGDLPGDCHVQCLHPGRKALNVEGNPRGIKRGWFFWPYNFDPVWLQACDGFTAKAADAGKEVENA